MKKLACLVALIAGCTAFAVAQTTTTVVKNEKTTKKTSSVPEKVHNTFSKNKEHNGKKTKTVKVVQKTTPAK